MNSTAEAILEKERNFDFQDVKMVEFAPVRREQIMGLCMTCSQLADCKFPMRGKAIYCEEYD
jgi:hypothetical protein